MILPRTTALHSDELGKKVSNSYFYEVCEIPLGACASDTLQF